MAAGMGSRFGGPKQITPIGKNGEFIIDYSIYDAIKAGFTKVVFIIKKEHQEIFNETIEKRINGKIKTEYVYQEMDMIPQGTKVPEERTKPWGTVHAVLCAKNLVNEPFAVINADDFYGRDAYVKAADYLKTSTDPNEGAIISYPYDITSSRFGAVKRGIIEVKDGFVTKITESKVSSENGKAHCEPLDGSTPFETELTHPVSMNFFAFSKEFMNLFEHDFAAFMRQDEEILKTKECLLPDVAQDNLAKGTIKLRNIVTNGTWTGITYKEDLEDLHEKLTTLIANEEYPENIWETNN